MTDPEALPQLGDAVFLTDGGLETDLIFNHHLELPQFASFVLFDDPDTEETLRNYFRDYLALATESGHGVVLETATWRANTDWGDLLGYDHRRLREVNRRAVDQLLDLRDRETDAEVVVSGCVGPRGDAYADHGSMAADEAARYHATQVEALVDAGVDLISALTITNTAEAIGIVRAVEHHDASVAISFTVETDGTLPTGTTLVDAIRTVDDATGAGPAYYMVNCAHPDHFAATFALDDPVLERVRGIRANASRRSHLELDESDELDDGDPGELGTLMATLHRRRPHINVLGGCCGTDSRHITAIARSLAV